MQLKMRFLLSALSLAFLFASCLCQTCANIAQPAEGDNAIILFIGKTNYGQTFTPTCTGKVESITVGLTTLNNGKPLYVGVYPGAGEWSQMWKNTKKPTLMVQSSPATPPTGKVDQFKTTTFSFPTPFQVTAGSPYTFVVLWTDITTSGQRYQQFFTPKSTYGGPQDVVHLSLFASPSVSIDNADLNFQITYAQAVYVNSNPAPGGTLDFSFVDLGKTSQKNIDVTGQYNLQLTNGKLTGANAGDFSLDTTFPLAITDTTLPVQASCKPQGVTSHMTATLMFDSNDGDGNPSNSITFTLLCQLPIAYSSVPPPGSTIDFGDVPMGQPKQLSIDVTGVNDLVLTNGKLSGGNIGDFSLDTTFPLAISDTTLPVKISCNPSNTSPMTTTLMFDSNDGDGNPSNSIIFNLLCQLPIAYSSVPPPGSTIDFGDVPMGQTAQRSIAVKGVNALVLTNLQLTGPDAIDFTIDTTFPVAITDTTINVLISCTPQALKFQRFAQLEFDSNDADGNPANSIKFTLYCVTPRVCAGGTFVDIT